MKVQEFKVTFDGENIPTGRLEDIIYQGLQFYDEVKWKNFSIEKEGVEEND